MIVTLAIVVFASCKATLFGGGIGNVVETRVELSQANFKVLGSFIGVATAKKSQISVKGDAGLVALAKADLLQKAKAAGIELSGSKTLINVTIDQVENKDRITVSISADIIEFNK
jgi:hypothetical protein